MPEPGGDVITHKVGPLPLIAWVAGGAGLVFLLLMMKNGSNNAGNVSTNQVSALAPTEAEAFGTIEQQQQDVTNALTTLGQNQSYLGGSLATLTGITTQQGADNAAAFQNLQNGQQQIQQGQAAASSQATNYYNGLAGALANYFNSLSGQVAGVNSNVTQVGQAVGTVSTNQTTNQNALVAWLQSIAGGVQYGNQLSQGISGQVGQVQASVGGTQADVDAIGRFLGWQFYQIPNRYAAYIPGQGPGNYGGTPVGML